MRGKRGRWRHCSPELRYAGRWPDPTVRRRGAAETAAGDEGRLLGRRGADRPRWRKWTPASGLLRHARAPFKSGRQRGERRRRRSEATAGGLLPCGGGGGMGRGGSPRAGAGWSGRGWRRDRWHAAVGWGAAADVSGPDGRVRPARRRFLGFGRGGIRISGKGSIYRHRGS